MSERDFQHVLAEVYNLEPTLGAKIEEATKNDDTSDRSLAHAFELMMHYLCDCVNTRDWDNPLVVRYLHPEFIWINDLGVSATTSQEFLDRMREAVKADPKYNMDCVDACGSIAKNGASAKIWLTLRVSGLPNEVEKDQVRDIIGKLKWERIDGSWYWTRHEAMRGGFSSGWEFG